MQDVVDAYNEIERARDKYHEAVREAIAGGVQQTVIAKALGKTRESIRRAALPKEQRQELSRRDMDRLRKKRDEQNRLLANFIANK